MTASAIVHAIQAEGVPREIAIVAREPEESVTALMMIAACITGLVLISEELEEGGGKGARMRKRNPGTVPTAEVMAVAPPWLVVRAQKSAGVEVSISLLTTALLLY